MWPQTKVWGGEGFGADIPAIDAANTKGVEGVEEDMGFKITTTLSK